MVITRIPLTRLDILKTLFTELKCDELADDAIRISFDDEKHLQKIVGWKVVNFIGSGAVC